MAGTWFYTRNTSNNTMRKIIVVALAAMLACSCGYNRQGLSFNPKNGVEAELTMPDGQVVRYTAYEKLYYVRRNMGDCFVAPSGT